MKSETKERLRIFCFYFFGVLADVALILVLFALASGLDLSKLTLG